MLLKAVYDTMNDQERMELQRIFMAPSFIAFNMKLEALAKDKIALIDPSGASDKIAQEYRVLRGQLDAAKEAQQLSLGFLQTLKPKENEQ